MSRSACPACWSPADCDCEAREPATPPEPRITPAMLRRLRAALRRDWLVVRSIQREAWPIIDAWAARENRRTR